MAYIGYITYIAYIAYIAYITPTSNNKKSVQPFGRLYATLYILLYRYHGKNNFLVKGLSFETIQVKILAWGIPQIAFNCIFCKLHKEPLLYK